ncbi:MAG: 3-oxoacyl-ACP reductase [Chloroflexi bacterium]|nr:3-oxoacyl-ACP reductase [Chloroflexota bacterium]MCH2532207.1 SDR family oxidoreductase [Dehalococcoidia bacterium]|tara:strand:+ start:1449 stop:2258 length:810 start_codon:yes stop_codon:yes gene_type:complete
MPGRVENKIAIVIGAGQTPGDTIGNGRATAILLAREGAKVVVADQDLISGQETVDMIIAEGNEAIFELVDAVSEESVRILVNRIKKNYGTIDILHNNVGASLALGDAVAVDLTEEAFDRSFAVNLKSHWMACKHVIPIMREQGGGSIVNISSLAVLEGYPYLGYKTMKTAIIAMTQNLAMAHADAAIRVNAILPGLMNTPMAIEARVAAGTPREQVIASRNARVPLGNRMGTAWDVAYAALFLHSDEAQFISGIWLPVDGASWASQGRY